MLVGKFDSILGMILANVHSNWISTTFTVLHRILLLCDSIYLHRHTGCTGREDWSD